MAKQIKNPNQSTRVQLYEYPGDNALGHPFKPGDSNYIGPHKIKFDKANGYHFSDDKNMERVVNYFVKELGFKEVKAVKKPAKKKED